MKKRATDNTSFDFSSLKISCDCCGKRILISKAKEFSTPHGALIVSCKRKKCIQEVTKVFIDLWGTP